MNEEPNTGGLANDCLGDAPPAALASTRHTVRFLFIVSGISVIGFLQGQQSTREVHVSRIPFYASVAALQLLFVWFVRKGIRPRGRSIKDLLGRRCESSRHAARDALLAIGFVLVMEGWTIFLRRLFGPLAGKTAFLIPHGPVEAGAWFALALIAGICEEIVYRGYLQPQLWALTRSLPVAVTIQALVFATAHAYQGWRAALVTGVYGLAFGVLAAWRRSIIPGALAHCIIDVIGGLFPR